MSTETLNDLVLSLIGGIVLGCLYTLVATIIEIGRFAWKRRNRKRSL